jgi:hypothetical protein
VFVGLALLPSIMAVWRLFSYLLLNIPKWLASVCCYLFMLFADFTASKVTKLSLFLKAVPIMLTDFTLRVYSATSLYVLLEALHAQSIVGAYLLITLYLN